MNEGERDEFDEVYDRLEDDAPAVDAVPADPEYGMSLSIGLTQAGVKVLVMKLPVAVEGLTPEGQVSLGECILDPEDAENVAVTIIEALRSMGYVSKTGHASVGALADVANAKVDAVAEVVAEKNGLN